MPGAPLRLGGKHPRALHDPGDHVGFEVSCRVDDLSALRRPKRADRSIPIALVAFDDLLEHLAVLDDLSAKPELCNPAARPLLGCGIQKNLQGGIGKHNASLIASL